MGSKRQEMSGIRRLVIIATLAILLAALVLLGSQDKGVSVADTSVPDSEVATSVSRSSSASAGMTITMYTEPDD